RIVLGGVASWPQEIPEAAAALRDGELGDDAIAAAAAAAYRPAKPLDNTDFDLSWRKQMTRVYVKAALEELPQRRGLPASVPNHEALVLQPLQRGVHGAGRRGVAAA